MKILNDTPRPNVPSQKAWLEIASDNHSRIFTTLLPQPVLFILNFVYCVHPHPSHKARLFVERERERQTERQKERERDKDINKEKDKETEK